ncbi:MAG: hypothetical protein AAFN50_12375 [Pseudomonadota bacterium]
MTLPKQRQVHRHGTQRDCAAYCCNDNPAVGAVQRRGGNKPENEPPGVATYRQFAIFDEQLVEDVAIALQQLRAELEQFHFLDAIFPRDHRFQVNLHARVRRAPAE